MDIDAEREKIRQEIKELERSLGPAVATIEVEVSGSSQESGSEDEDGTESEEDSSACVSMEVDPEVLNGAGGEEGEAAASIDLPRTPETCLQMNLVYQEVLQEKLEEVNALLAQNREQQEKLTWELAGTRGSKSDNGKSLPSNMFLGHFMKPYFKDKTSGLGPPANSDAREKARQGIKSFEELITTKWKSQEKELLRQAVMSDRLRRLIQPKLMNLEYLNEKRMKCRDDVGKEILDKQIREKEREISDINSLPEETLLGNRGDEHDWEKIANVNFEGTRSSKELRRFWQNTEHPSINKKEWSEDEIEKLKEIAARHNNLGWEAIAKELGTQRTAFQCLQMFQANNRGFRKSEWSPKEDQMLLQLVQEMRVGKHIPYRKIAYYMEGRDSTQLLYRWTKRVDPNLKRGAWTSAEDALLLKAVAKHGERDWYKIRAEVPGRSDLQCRYRYLHSLHQDIKKGKWSPEEETKLVELIEKYGVGHWAKIASELPHRSGGQCLSKWKIMLGYRRNWRKKREGCLPRKPRKRIPRTSPCLSETSSDDSDMVLEDSGEEGPPRGHKERGPGRWRVPSLDLWVPTRKTPPKQKPKALPSAPVLSKGFDVNRKRGPAGGPSLDQGDGPSPAATVEAPARISEPGQPKAPEESAEDGHQDSRSMNDSWRVSLAYVKYVLRNNSYELQRRTRDLRRKRRFAGPAAPRQASVSGPNGGPKDPGQKDGMWKTTVYRRLMMAVTPWAGSNVQSWAIQVKANASRRTKADFISEQLQLVHLTSRPLFTLLIQLLRIDVDGCMKVIQRKKPKQAELLRSAVGAPGKKAQASSAPTPKAPPPSPPAGPLQASKKLIPLKAKEGQVPASTWEAVPYRSASKPKTVSELLREKRLREAKAAQQQQQRKVLLVPPLLLSPPVIVQPQRLPGAGTARVSPGPNASQALVVAGAPGQPGKTPTHNPPALVASPPASPRQIVPVTWVLTPQGLLPLTIVGLPSQGVVPSSGSGGSPNPAQAAEAFPMSAPSPKVAPLVAGSSKGPSSSAPPPNIPLPPSPQPSPAEQLLVPSCPSSEVTPPDTAPTPGLTGAPLNQVAGDNSQAVAPPAVAVDPPRPAGQPPQGPAARTEEKFSPDYSLLSQEEVAVVKAWAKAGSCGGALSLESCLPYFPPFLCSLKTLSALLLQKDRLAERAASLLAAEGDPGQPCRPGLAGLRALVQQRLGENPAYQLLRRRFLAALTLPAALAALPPPRVTTTLSGGQWWQSSSGGEEDNSRSSLEEEDEEEEEEELEEEMEGDGESHGASGDGPGRASGSPDAQESHPRDPEAPGTDGAQSEPLRVLRVRSSLRLQERRSQR